MGEVFGEVTRPSLSIIIHIVLAQSDNSLFQFTEVSTMNVAVFSARPYDQDSFQQANTSHNHTFTFFEARLSLRTSKLCKGFDAVCAFINDELNEDVLEAIAALGVRFIALRCAGFNQVDLNAAKAHGFTVARVPAYSPYAVAEHAVALVLSLNRKIYRAYNRVRDDNFMLDGLLGFDLHGQTVGVIGTGKIGECFARIMKGFGCQLLGYDVQENQACIALGMEYVTLPEIFSTAKIISLHCPLLPQTHHMINAKAIASFQPNTMLINTSRGGLIDTNAAIQGIKSGQIGYLGIDVYEQEADLFFNDHSDTIIQDDTFQLLQSFPNVVITAHQAFFTKNALNNIAQTTLENLDDMALGKPCKNEVKA